MTASERIQRGFEFFFGKFRAFIIFQNLTFCVEGVGSDAKVNMGPVNFVGFIEIRNQPCPFSQKNREHTACEGIEGA